MTYLPTFVQGAWVFLYLILALFSRRIVGREVHAADHATALVGRTALAKGIAALDVKLVLHGDNGATLKATTVLAMLEWLGVNRSCDWSYINAVTLNPERDSVVKAHLSASDTLPLAA